MDILRYKMIERYKKLNESKNKTVAIDVIEYIKHILIHKQEADLKDKLLILEKAEVDYKESKEKLEKIESGKMNLPAINFTYNKKQNSFDISINRNSRESFMFPIPDNILIEKLTIYFSAKLDLPFKNNSLLLKTPLKTENGFILKGLNFSNYESIVKDIEEYIDWHKLSLD